MFSIKVKIVLAYTLAFGMLLGGFAAAIYESLYEAEIAKLDARLETHTDKLQTELEEDHLEPGFPKLAGARFNPNRRFNRSKNQTPDTQQRDCFV